MKNNRQDISIRIQGAREAFGMTAEEAAEKLHLDPETYLAYEKGEKDIPMGAIPQIAALFDADPFAILTGINAHSKVYAVTRAGKGPIVERRAAYHYESLNAAFSNAVMMPYFVTVEPPADGEAVLHLNSHPGEEFDLVVKGSMEVSVEGHSVILNEGDSIYYDATRMHGMRAVGGAPARFLAVITA